MKCPECGNERLVRDYHLGQLVCGKCGYVITEGVMDFGPEWRAFNSEQREKRSRAGPPQTPLIHDKGLSTLIDWKNEDASGHKLSAERRAEIYRLRKWQRRAIISTALERNLGIALSEIERMGSLLNLPRYVRETAALIYRQVMNENLVRGRSIEGMASAALYLACRTSKVVKTLTEIAEVSRVSRKEISRSYRVITKRLGVRVEPFSPQDFVPKLVAQLNLSPRVEAKAIEILKKFKKFSGQTPIGLAAAAVYIAAQMVGERRTQMAVANAAKLTEVTVRSRCHELSQATGYNFKHLK